MNLRHPVGVLHSFSIKNIFCNKMDLRLFYFDVTKQCECCHHLQLGIFFLKKYFLLIVTNNLTLLERTSRIKRGINMSLFKPFFKA